MAQKNSVDKALNLVRNLIERLRDLKDEKNEEGEHEVKGASTFFLKKELGGLYLTEKADKQYRECLDSLVAVLGKNATASIQSRGAVQDLLQNAILRAVRPRKDPKSEDPATFRRRISRELNTVRKQLLAAPSEWKVTIQVLGIKATTLPFTFGGIEFLYGSEDVGRKLANCIPDYDPTPKRVSKKTIQEEHAHREKIRNTITKKLSTETVATVSVHAFDVEAAENLGTERIRRSVDILNFFAPYFHDHPDVYRAFLASDGKRIRLPSLVRGVNVPFARWIEEKSYDTPIEAIDPHSEKGRKIGLARAGEIFAQREHTDLDLRILNAVSWAGRATVEHRREEAFLLWAIALEALLTNPKARSGVTDRLRFRAAWLIGADLEGRKRVRDLVGNLYVLRSNIVHAGDSTDLTDGDLKKIRKVVRASVTCVLTDARFSKLRRATEFEESLDDHLWS